MRLIINDIMFATYHLFHFIVHSFNTYVINKIKVEIEIDDNDFILDDDIDFNDLCK